MTSLVQMQKIRLHFLALMGQKISLSHFVLHSAQLSLLYFKGLMTCMFHAKDVWNLITICIKTAVTI